MFPADELSVPDKEYLHHCLPLVLIYGNDILVFSHALRDLLLLGHLLHAVVKIPIACGALKVQRLCSRLHLSLQLLQDPVVITVQKFQRLGHLLPILPAADIALTRGQTLLDMMIQAGTLKAYVLRQTAVAGSQLIELIQKLYGILHCRRAGIRPEVFGLILFHNAGKQDAWIFFPHRHLNIRVGLVILQQRVVLGRIFLDQIVFQNQSFQLRVRDDIFKSGDQGHHLVDHRPPADVIPKIGAHPIMEVHRLAHIQNDIFVISHNIDSRLLGKLL